MAHINVSKYFLFCGTIASVQALEQVLVVTEYYGGCWSVARFDFLEKLIIIVLVLI